MLINELKIFFDGINHFRQLLKEGIGENVIADAIEKHKIVYIYYAGDDTVMKGYRSIKPMTLGQTKKEGESYQLLRAWQEAGSTDSNKKYSDSKGRMKPGWRLFRADKITSFLPTGKYFSVDEDKMPDGYNSNDSQMTNIVASIQINTGKPETNVSGNVTQQKLAEPPSVFSGQKEKFQYFSKAGKKQKEATKEEIEHLWAIAKTIKKKSPDKLIVIADENGDMILKDENLKNKFLPDSVVGNLKDLYLKYVKPNQSVDNSFFKKAEDKIVKETNSKNQRNTFFK